MTRTTATASTLAGLLMWAPIANAEIELKSPDGAFAVRGELQEVTATQFLIQTSVGPMTLERAAVECFGEGCPAVNTVEAELTIRGSDTIGEELMPLLLAGYAESIGAGFAEEQVVGPDTIAMSMSEDSGFGPRVLTAVVQSAGSSTGLRALVDKQTDIAMSSRPARANEIRTIASQGRGNIADYQQEYIIAVDSIITIISPSNPVDALSISQLADIFSGRVSNWAQVGGADMPIVVITRPETSGTRGVFENAILGPVGATMSSSAIVMGSNSEISQMVQRTPGAIGYVGFAYTNGAKELDLVSSCGIVTPATSFTAKTEEYPLQRRLRLFTDNSPLSDETRSLLDFAVSEEADTFVSKAGFIDLEVEIDPTGLDSAHVLEMAAIGGEAAAYEAMGPFINDFRGAERLSTTFRFVVGSSDFDNKALRDLNRMVGFLQRPEYQGREIIVAGFSDSAGNFFFNKQLSTERAQTVADALLREASSQGITDLNLRVAGYGELSPVACNDTQEGQARNRRVELWLK